MVKGFGPLGGALIVAQAQPLDDLFFDLFGIDEFLGFGVCDQRFTHQTAPAEHQRPFELLLTEAEVHRKVSAQRPPGGDGDPAMFGNGDFLQDVLDLGSGAVGNLRVLVEHHQAPSLGQMCIRDRFYSAAPEQNPDYPRIVNQAHYERLCEMLGEGTVVAGGRTNEQELKISPTIIENAPFYSKLMNDEIFGPLLPVIEFSQLEQAYEYISLHERPLALYLFTRRPQVEREVLQKIQFGGGCVNDTVVHLCPHDMPFGGIGPSGIGSYHGKAGFDTFTHYKSVLKTRGRLDLQLRYPPFGKVSPLVQRLLR